MHLGVSAGELAVLIAVLLAAGLVAGTLAGLLGIGGGGVLVPVLYEVFGVLGVDPAVRMHVRWGPHLRSSSQPHSDHLPGIAPGALWIYRFLSGSRHGSWPASSWAC